MGSYSCTGVRITQLQSIPVVEDRPRYQRIVGSRRQTPISYRFKSSNMSDDAGTTNNNNGNEASSFSIFTDMHGATMPLLPVAVPTRLAAGGAKIAVRRVPAKRIRKLGRPSPTSYSTSAQLWYPATQLYVHNPSQCKRHFLETLCYTRASLSVSTAGWLAR